jgi:hypothetical protein
MLIENIVRILPQRAATRLGHTRSAFQATLHPLAEETDIDRLSA